MEHKSHIVCIPAPPQGHINPMMKLAELLHSKGFYITFVITEYAMARIANSLGEDSLNLQGRNDFTFETIPDGLPPNNKRGVLDLPEMVRGFKGEPKNAFRSLLKRLLASPDIPPITSIISDAVLNFVIDVSKELDISVFLLNTSGACGMLGFMQSDELLRRGLFPLKDETCLTNGYLDTPIDWVKGLIKGAKMKHLPTFIRTTDPNDTMFDFLAEAARNASVGEGMIHNTFDDLEGQVLEEMKTKVPNLYTIGPLALLSQQVNKRELLPLNSSLWKEDTDCIQWLDKRSPASVVYVNYGSLTTLTPDQLREFAWGLANSKHPFLWVIRPDLVQGGTGIITDDYMEEIKGRGFIVSWCPQEKVLQHPSVAVFLTHCGWNSTSESISKGVPMICWPFFGEQQINSLYISQEWRIGVEMEEGDVRRERLEELVREMVEGERGKELKRKAMEWKRKAEEATKPGGSSYNNFDKLVKYLMKKENHCLST